MATRKSLAAVLLIGTIIASAPAGAAPPREGAPNRSLDSLNQPVVERTDLVLTLSARDDGLPHEERLRLRNWFDSLGVGYGDRVWVEDPYGPGRIRHDIARIAADYGLLLSQGAPVTGGAVEPGSVRVILGRSTASVPGCPNWDGRGGINSTSPNYGCSINSNLAAMIADPSDLVLGQAGTGTDAKTAAKAIKVYRDKVPTGSQGLNSSQSRGN